MVDPSELTALGGPPSIDGASITPERVRAENILDDPNLTAMATVGEGTQENPYVIEQEFIDGHTGTLRLGQHYHVTDGLDTNSGQDFSNDAVYFRGEGVAATILRQGDPETPVITFDHANGNFGGVTGMTIYGLGRDGDEDGDEAPLIKLESGIDQQIRNCIVRFGGGDVIDASSTSTSGLRLQNCWLETSSGWGLITGRGRRAKIDNNHIVGVNGGGISVGLNDSDFSNLTLDVEHPTTAPSVLLRDDASHNRFDNVRTEHSSGKAVEIAGGRGNQFSNLYLRKPRRGVFARGDGRNQFSNVGVYGCDRQAVVVYSDRNQFSNLYVENFGIEGAAYEALLLLGDVTHVQNAVVHEERGVDGGRNVLRVGGDHTYVDGLAATPRGVSHGIEIEPTALETVLDGVRGVAFADVTDDGVRTLVNRWGTNRGDPRSRGEWAGHADYAGEMGATVWDTSASPWTAYAATPNGQWVRRAAGGG